MRTRVFFSFLGAFSQVAIGIRPSGVMSVHVLWFLARPPQGAKAQTSCSPPIVSSPTLANSGSFLSSFRRLFALHLGSTYTMNELLFLQQTCTENLDAYYESIVCGRKFAIGPFSG